MAQNDFFMLVCQDNEHNKFWTFDIVPCGTSSWECSITYGRIGTKGQVTRKMFIGKLNAEVYAAGKKAEKRSKGYVQVSKEEFDLMKIQAQIMGTGNKIEDTMILVEVGDDRLYSIPPKAAYDPSLKVCLGVIFRLREEGQATPAYFVMFKDDDVYDVAITSRRYPGDNHLKALNGWFVLKTKINDSHPLHGIVGKLGEVLGSTL